MCIGRGEEEEAQASQPARGRRPGHGASWRSHSRTAWGWRWRITDDWNVPEHAIWGGDGGLMPLRTPRVRTPRIQALLLFFFLFVFVFFCFCGGFPGQLCCKSFNGRCDPTYTRNRRTSRSTTLPQTTTRSLVPFL